MDETHIESRLTTFITSALVFLLPVFLIPVAVAPFQFSKVLIATVAALVLVMLLAKRALHQGALTVSWTSLSLALLVLPAAYLVGAIFSSHPSLSFMGYELDADSFGFIALGCALALLVAHTTSRSRIMAPFMALLYASWAVFAFQIVQVIGHTPLPFAVLSNPTINLVGSWTDFGIFAGLVVALLMFAVDAFPLSFFERSVATITLAVAVFFLMLSTTRDVWIVLAIESFVLLVYAFVRRYARGADTEGASLHGVAPAAVFVIALLFSVTTGPTTALQNAFHIQSLDVRPSMTGTLNVLEGVYAHSPVVGSGPNTFTPAWLLYRPASVATSLFWNTDFGAGSGSIPTAAAVGGVVVLMGWLVFLLTVLWGAARSMILLPVGDDRTYFVSTLAVLGVVYLVVMEIIRVPSQSLALLMFVMVGLFLVSLKGSRLSHTSTISFREAPRVGFVIVVIFLVMIMAGIVGTVTVGRVYASSLRYNQALAAGNRADAVTARTRLGQALALAQEDRYYRAAAALDLVQLSTIVSSGKSDAGAQNDFKAALAAAIKDSGSALQIDPQGYRNLLAREDVYAAVVPLKIAGAFDNAATTITAARTLSPNSPELDLRLAQINIVNGTTADARKAIAAALAKKADYTDAILLLAQVELNAGDIGKAITAVENAVYFDPQNPTLLYQLGVLLLSDKQYQNAATAFETALTAQPGFQNAQFFLAEVYAFLGRYTDATKLMGELVTKNPDNDTVKGYQASLAAGKNPFNTVTAPAEGDTAPAKPTKSKK